MLGVPAPAWPGSTQLKQTHLLYSFPSQTDFRGYLQASGFKQPAPLRICPLQVPSRAGKARLMLSVPWLPAASWLYPFGALGS